MAVGEYRSEFLLKLICMSQSFLTRRTIFGLPGALLILLIFFFLLPSAFRGARLAIAGKKNNIKDWLPSDFRETVELDWFARYFMGESFIIATWDGCTSADQRLGLFASKLRHESTQREVPDTPDHSRAREVAESLQLFLEPAATNDWGGKAEKWFSSPSGQFYYITPDGRLYRWDEGTNAVGGLVRAVQRLIGRFELQGQFVAAFGEPGDAERVNEFYNDPSRLAASLFQTIETGNDMVDKLAAEGGPLWPIDLTDVDQRAVVARTRALERLTGTLFAPAVPPGFDWSPAAVFAQLPEETQEAIPDDFDFLVRRGVEQLQQRFGGTLKGLQDATIDEQGTAWDDLCRMIGVPTPPRQTCVLVTLTPLGKDHLGHAVGRGVVGGPRGRLLILADQSGLGAAPPPSMAPPPFDSDEQTLATASGRTVLHLGGPPIDNVSIDEEGTITLVRLVGYSGLIGLALSFFCFRSFNLTLMIFTVGVTAAVLGLAISYWTGGHVDAILMSMPSLVYVLGLSGAIHIVNYYRDEVRKRGTVGAAARAAHHAWVPCTLAALTTSLGLISLCTSNIIPIYNFGLYAAAAVMATLVVLFTYLPAALEIFPPRFAIDQRQRDEESAGSPGAGAGDGKHIIAEFWAAVGRFVTAHHRLVTVVCLSVFVVGLLGIPKIKTSVQLLKLFDSESRIIADYAYLEENFGKLVPMELVVRMPTSMIGGGTAIETNNQQSTSPSDVVDRSAHPLTLLQRAEAILRIDTAVRRTLGESGTGVIGRTMSAGTFLPPLPEPTSSYSPIRGRFESQLNESIEELTQSDFFRRERDGPFAGSELWRISLRVGALSDVDYGQFVGDLRKTVTPVLDAYRARESILAACDETLESATAQAGSSATATPRRRETLRVLLIGSGEPKRMESEDFLAVADSDQRDQQVESAVADGRQSDLVMPEKLYLSALGELLAGERMRRPVWLDLDSDLAKVTPESPQWQPLLDAVDVVVLVGDQQAISPAELAAVSKKFVDVRLETLPEASPILIDNIPTESAAGPLQAIYTGVVPVVYKAQRTLLVSLIESIVLAFFLIAFVMITLLIPGRYPGVLLQPTKLGCGLAAGMVAMVPNLFPVVVIFGMMGHSHMLVDIGTMMTASVAMGVAVDDTIHFLTWFRQHIDAGLSRVEAVIETYRRVGPAMTQTTIVGGLGLFVFALSTFTPTQRFGTLMLVLLAAALVGDLILLPALLAGPLGRWFRPRPPVPAAPQSASVLDEQPAVGTSASAGDQADIASGDESALGAEEESGLVMSDSIGHRPPPSPMGNRGGSKRGEPANRNDG